MNSLADFKKNFDKNFKSSFSLNCYSTAALIRSFPQRLLLRWVWDWFQKADKNKDGKMNFKEVKKLLKMMNVDMNEEHALHLFTVSRYYCF